MGIAALNPSYLAGALVLRSSQPILQSITANVAVGTEMKHLQVLAGVAALAAAAVQCRYLLGIGHATTNIQPLTTALYVLFFWVLWAYGRMPDFITPVFKLGQTAIRSIAFIAIIGPLLMAFAISSTSEVARASMVKYGVLNAGIMAAYLLVAIVLFFGDRWLGVAGRLLKLGREFPRRST